MSVANVNTQVPQFEKPERNSGGAGCPRTSAHLQVLQKGVRVHVTRVRAWRVLLVHLQKAARSKVLRSVYKPNQALGSWYGSCVLESSKVAMTVRMDLTWGGRAARRCPKLGSTTKTPGAAAVPAN